jgi:hypothetical protein
MTSKFTANITATSLLNVRYSIQLADNGYTRSDELRLSPAACDTKSSSRVIAIIIPSLNNILLFLLKKIEKVFCMFLCLYLMQ